MERKFQTGDTVVLPAGLKEGRVRTTDNALWLEVSIPIASSLSGFPRPDRESLMIPDHRGGLIQVNVPKKDS